MQVQVKVKENESGHAVVTGLNRLGGWPSGGGECGGEMGGGLVGGGPLAVGRWGEWEWVCQEGGGQLAA